MEFRLGEKIVVANAGDFVHSPQGELHTWKNTGSIPAKVLFFFTPAGIEKLFDWMWLARFLAECYPGDPVDSMATVVPASFQPLDQGIQSFGKSAEAAHRGLAWLYGLRSSTAT